MADVLLSQYLSQLRAINHCAPVLDLACGSGKNGLYLARSGLNTLLADINNQALADINHIVQSEKLPANIWQVDFENPQAPVAPREFSAIVVYRYLHRPLFNWIKQSVMPGGLLIYSTFTHQQAAIGRPQRAEFLLQDNELAQIFAGWEILHHWQGMKNEPHCAMAEIVARKPL